MAKVTTWEVGPDRRLTNMVTVRATFDLSLNEMVDGLCSKYIRNGADEIELPESLSAAQILDTIRAEYAHYGMNATWTWCESGTFHMTDDEAREWAERLIIAAFPEMGKNRG